MAAITGNLALGDFGYSGGFYPTLLNIAPNYSGLLSGISTFVAYLCSCPSTLVNTIIIKQVGTKINQLLSYFQYNFMLYIYYRTPRKNGTWFFG